MGHGAGGTLTFQLIEDYVLKNLGGSSFEVPLEALDDAAVVNGIVLKSDSHTVKLKLEAEAQDNSLRNYWRSRNCPSIFP